MAATAYVIAVALAAYFAKPEIEKSADGIPLMGVGFADGQKPLSDAQVRRALAALSDRLNVVERSTERTFMVERILQSRRNTGLVLGASVLVLFLNIAEFGYDRRKEALGAVK